MFSPIQLKEGFTPHSTASTICAIIADLSVALAWCHSVSFGAAMSSARTFVACKADVGATPTDEIPAEQQPLLSVNGLWNTNPSEMKKSFMVKTHP